MEKLNAKENAYEVIIVGDGTNRYLEFKRSTLPFKFKFKDSNLVYEVQPSDLFVLPRRFKDILRRVPHRFISVFMEGSSAAIAVETDKITSELLYIAESSDRLRLALKDLFKGEFGLPTGMKKFLFIGIIIIVIAAVVLVATGRISLKGLIPI